jgi:hypothetical protein
MKNKVENVIHRRKDENGRKVKRSYREDKTRWNSLLPEAMCEGQ